MAADEYCYPGTNILRNKAGLRDDSALRQYEYAKTMLRAADAPALPLTGQGYKDLHRHLFQNVYDWAGEVRRVNMSKGSSRFANSLMIDGALDDRFKKLRAERYLQGLSMNAFADRAAFHLSELNAIHPFREGNGRVMKLHLVQLANQAGYSADAARISSDQWNAASIQGFHGEHSLLQWAIATTMRPTRDTEDPVRSKDPFERPPTPLVERHKAFREMMAAEREKRASATDPDAPASPSPGPRPGRSSEPGPG